jgi:TonB-linked SusC/RagA family outer membrane protein
LWENTATFNKRFGDHNFTALAGVTAEQFSGDFVNGTRRGVPADPSLWYLGGSGDPNTALSNGGGDKWARNSYIARVNYGFNDKYLFTATFRADGSSRFPTQNRWAYIPSFGVGWVISEEGFMQGQELFDNLKLRASWGRLGNDNIPSNAFTVTATTGLPYFFNNNIFLGSVIEESKDENLRWEITEEFDIGFEFSLLNRRLTGEMDFYDKKTKDALVFINVPAIVSASGRIITNAATIQNRGFETSLRWADDINKDFSYFIGGNITFNKNRTLNLNGGQALLEGGVGQQGFITRSDNHVPIGSFYVLQVLGIFQNQEEIDNYVDKNGKIIQPDARPGDFKYQDVDGNGVIDLTADRVYAGSYQPKTYFGITAGFNYKQLDFSIDFYGNVGNKIYNGKRAFRYETTDNIEAAVAANRWQPHRPSLDYPRAKEGYWPASTFFIESGDFFRINNMTIGYTLPEGLLKRVRLSSFRVFLTGQNIWTGQKFSGFTPELPGSSPLNAGIELNAYPTTKTFAVGVNVGF